MKTQQLVEACSRITLQKLLLQIVDLCLYQTPDQSCVSMAIILKLTMILSYSFMIECAGKNYLVSRINKNHCPFVEALSFGSDIDIKCNNSYLIFNQTVSDTFHWKFANETSTCKQNDVQQGFIGQCGIKRLGLRYLKVRLKSVKSNEYACIYCRINYKPIAPLIDVLHTSKANEFEYTITITSTQLAQHESFEIFLAKRASGENLQSVNYWFSRKCIDSSIKDLEYTGHSIKFTVDDIEIERVEFLLRRCSNNCRKYVKCSDEEWEQDVTSSYIRTPKSIEKLSCDYECLYGISTREIAQRSSLVLSTTTTRSLSSTQPKTDRTIIRAIVLSLLLLILILIILVVFIIQRIKSKNYGYSKPMNNEPKQTNNL